ncbi:hypothetical protein MRQ36_02160 [Micromonospora sp. R77]|uniref:hypothetical protein n=1 Tax=Micromonospora sp. R77 TaxID=2925836 RepID=UPI001F625487|nr:hypothetical protein [Micromonospora sp. R77]MCI4061442.1 hypothetical protein [Micromonospora sp. R77]
MHVLSAPYRALAWVRGGLRVTAITLLATLLIGLGGATPARADGLRQFQVGSQTQVSLQFGGANSPYDPGCYQVQMDRPDPRWPGSIMSFYITANNWYPGSWGLPLNFSYTSYWQTVSVGTAGGVITEGGTSVSGALATIEPGAIVTVTRVSTIPISLPGNPYGWTCTPPGGEQCRDFTVTGEYGAVTYGVLLGNSDSRNVIDSLAYAQLKGRFCWQDGKVTQHLIKPIQYDFTSSPVPPGLFFSFQNPRNGLEYSNQDGARYQIDQAGVDVHLDIPEDIEISGVKIPKFGSRKIGSIKFDTALKGDGTVDIENASKVWLGPLEPKF